jgi:hypothetical protein
LETLYFDYRQSRAAIDADKHCFKNIVDDDVCFKNLVNIQNLFEALLISDYVQCTNWDILYFLLQVIILMLNAREKTVGAGEKFEDFDTHFRIN